MAASTTDTIDNSIESSDGNSIGCRAPAIQEHDFTTMHDDQNRLSIQDKQEGQEETLEDLLLRLQLEEIEELTANRKGKQREGTKDDFQLALELHHEELQTVSNSIKDQRMARSIVQALHSDGSILDAAIAVEAMVANDRTIAQALHNSSAGAIPAEIAQPATTSKDTTMAPSFQENLRRMLLAQDHEIRNHFYPVINFQLDHRIPTAESSKTAAKREPRLNNLQQMDQLEKQECVVCRDDVLIFDLANLPCTHNYCRGCLTRLFADSMTDESLFPPRCCSLAIVEEHVRMYLDPSVAEEFEKKKEELSTANRTYCRSQTCLQFIPPSAIKDDIATCINCGETTCSICKGSPHDRLECPQDTALEAILGAARDAGWQRCYSCWRIVELTYGCNHIICRCGAQFCYNCGERWRTCPCEEWTEGRLLQRATAILERDAPPRQEQPLIQPAEPQNIAQAAALPPVAIARPEIANIPAQSETDPGPDDDSIQRAMFVSPLAIRPASTDSSISVGSLNRIMDTLRANHVCDHGRWTYIGGRHRCEECTHMLPEYIFECRQCLLRACWRCRRNRL